MLYFSLKRKETLYFAVKLIYNRSVICYSFLDYKNNAVLNSDAFQNRVCLQSDRGP